MIERHVADERIARWTTSIPHPYPAGAARGFIDEVAGDLADGVGWTLAVVERTNHALVGVIRLDRIDEAETGEIGYWIAVDRWGRGYATEAARRVVGFGFADLALARIRTYVMSGNGASRRVLEKVGFTPDGHDMVDAPARGGAVAMDFFQLDRSNWRPDG